MSLVAALLALALCPLEAHAESAEQRAQKAFERGMRLMKKKSYKKACRALEESQRIQAGIGTQFRLAQCYEARGLLASAWRAFTSVATSARVGGQEDKAEFAQKRADELAPRLSRIALRVAPEAARLKGLEVRDNGRVIPAAEWGGTPVDKGSHKLEASAPGRVTWTITLDIEDEGQTLKVRVPELKEKPADAEPDTKPEAVKPDPSPDKKPAPEAQPPGPLDSPARVASLVLAIGGVGLMGASVGVGVAAKSDYDAAAPHCKGAFCDDEGLAIRDSARDTGTVATVLFSAGVAALAGGTLLWFLAPPKAETAAVDVQASAHGVVLRATTAW